MILRDAIAAAAPFFHKDRDTVLLTSTELAAYNGSEGVLVSLDGFEGSALVSGTKLKQACMSLGSGAVAQVRDKAIHVFTMGSKEETWKLPIQHARGAPQLPKLKTARWQAVSSQTTASLAALGRLVYGEADAGGFRMDVVASTESALLASDGVVAGVAWQPLATGVSVPAALVRGLQGPIEVGVTGRLVAVRSGPVLRWSPLPNSSYPVSLVDQVVSRRSAAVGVVEIGRSALVALAGNALKALDSPADAVTLAASPEGWVSLCGRGSKAKGGFESQLPVKVQADALCHVFVGAGPLHRAVQCLQAEKVWIRVLRDPGGLIVWDDTIEVLISAQHHDGKPSFPGGE